jgi:heat shock protein 1/8
VGGKRGHQGRQGKAAEGRDEDDEEEEEIEVKEKTIEKEVFLGALELVARQARKVGKRWRTSIEVQFLLDGKLEVSISEKGQQEKSSLVVN